MHAGWITSDFITDQHRAECSCGWKGNICFIEWDANQELGAHYADVKEE